MTEIVTIRSDVLTVEINRHGAELWRIRDTAGRDFLWDGDPAFWTGRAPILFPVVGESAGGKVTVEGRELPMERHGFARRQTFAVVEHHAGLVRLRLEDDAATRALWPFAFRLDLVFSVAGGTLAVVAEITNRDTRPMPMQFGFHPALRWPLPYGKARADHRMRFDAAEPAPIRRIDGAGLVVPETFASPVAGRDLALADALFEPGAMIWDEPESRGLVYGAPGAPTVTVTFPGVPMLGIWMKPGAGYVCVEPWQGHADRVDHAGEMSGRAGVVMLAAGETRRVPMAIAIGTEPLDA
jgi:galactose mutarotase-like enzyme